MAPEYFPFVWEVIREGYRWVETDSRPPLARQRPFLTRPYSLKRFRVVYDPRRHAALNPRKSREKVYAPKQPFSARRYQPLKKYTGLFRTFADLNPRDRNKILEFANHYGLLGIGESISLPFPLKADQQVVDVGGESHETWATEIQHMKWAIELWEMLQRKKPQELAHVIHGEGTKHVHYSRKFCSEEDFPVLYFDGLDANDQGYDLSYQVIARSHPLLHPERLKVFKPGDLELPARYCLQDMINKKLEASVSPRLLWQEGEQDRKQRQEPREPSKTLGLYFYPKNLLGCLWLQFAFLVEGNREYRKCVTCGRPFVLIPGKGRKDRKHCSASCRTKKWQQKKEAKQRHSQPARRQKRTTAA